MEWKSSNEKETNQIGKHIAMVLEPGDILLLQGDLGAGKTTLTKSIADYFGITKTITSPTFTLMNVYEVENSQKHITQLVHIDTYRLEREQELIDIGAEDYLGEKNTICIIEWPEKISDVLQNYKTKKVTIEHVGADERKIIFD